MVPRLEQRIKKGDLPNRRAIARELARFWYAARNNSEFNDGGITVFEEDWDVLIILDACRYDIFSEQAEIPGELRMVESQGAATPEWLKANVTGRDLTDTVCVSANGQYVQFADQLNAKWHAFEGVLDTELADAHGSQLVAPPEQVTDKALTIAERYPQKRLVIHYAQPHLPYLGSYGQQHFEPGMNPEELATDPAVNRDMMLRAYRENLDLVLQAVKRLLSASNTSLGRVVITSDHGELLGERVWPLPVQQWGHPIGVYHPKLVQVPWLVHDAGKRREHVAEDPEGATNIVDDYDKKALSEHLQALGYAD